MKTGEEVQGSQLRSKWCPVSRGIATSHRYNFEAQIAACPYPKSAGRPKPQDGLVNLLLYHVSEL